MPRTTEVINEEGGSIKVGTTGTIGSLMSQELSMKHSPQASSSSPRKHQTTTVSVPCGASPKRALQRRNSNIETGSSSSTNSSTDDRSPRDTHKSRRNPWQNRHRAPMLGPNGSPIDRSPNKEKVDKKGHAYIVEVVDVKCSNPVSNRLKKFSFSKLSESSV